MNELSSKGGMQETDVLRAKPADTLSDSGKILRQQKVRLQDFVYSNCDPPYVRIFSAHDI